MIFGSNDRFYPPVEQARDEAMSAGRGLYSPDVACTVLAQVRAVAATTDAATAVDALATAADLDGTAATAAAAAATGLVLRRRLGWPGRLHGPAVLRPGR